MSAGTTVVTFPSSANPSPQIVPLTNAPNQSIAVTLSVNGGSLSLNLSVYYNRQGKFWVMDVADSLFNPLVSSVPLIAGVWPGSNILSAFGYLGIGSAYVINQNGVASDWPNDTNLGTDFVLLWDSN